MYNIPHFKEPDAQQLIDFIQSHPFALLCGSDDHHQPVATQVPCFVEQRAGSLFLVGHIMKNTDHHKAFLKHSEVLVVFTGPHCYVSASWYSNPHTASTWNYMSVHARGAIRFLEHGALLSVLERTTNHFESNPDSPARFERLPADYVAQLSKAIVAFEIAITHMDHVFKLSQNKDRQSYERILQHLQQGNEQEKQIAAAMDQRKSQLFGDASAPGVMS